MTTMQKIDVIKIYQRKNALIVDDFPDMRGSIRRMLVNFGIADVETASTGAEAITWCENKYFDIILCDYNLGDGKNGQQVLEELRYRKLLKRTSAYMMITAETTKSMVFGALEYQPDDYLTKPFTQTVLQKRLDRLVLEKEELIEINRAMDEADYDRAIALCDEQINAQSRYDQKCYRIKAQCFLEKHLFPNAKTIYEKVLDERPVDWAQIGLGQCLMEMGDLDAAEQVFNELISQNCLCLEVYDALAQIKEQRGDIAGAQQLLEYASDISPNAILRQQLLAEISQTNGDLERAEKAHRKIVKLGANSCYDSPENYFKLARCISTQLKQSETKDRKRINEAEEVLDRARRRYRDNPDVRLQSDIINATVYADAGQVDESRKRIESVSNRINNESEDENASAQIALDLARCYQSMGDSEQAQQILRELAEKYPHDENIGEAIDRLSDEPLSQKGKEKAIELNRRGKELLSNQHFTEAVSLFGEALRHYPNNIAVKLNLLLASVRNMRANGPTADQIARCNKVINSVDALAEDHPLYERFQALWANVEDLEEELEEGHSDA
ncbi:MAG: tetratricopeptide repeat protein [Spongiibacteraceae bacterium]